MLHIFRDPCVLPHKWKKETSSDACVFCCTPTDAKMFAHCAEVARFWQSVPGPPNAHWQLGSSCPCWNDGLNVMDTHTWQPLNSRAFFLACARGLPGSNDSCTLRIHRMTSFCISLCFVLQVCFFVLCDSSTCPWDQHTQQKALWYNCTHTLSQASSSLR